jgi:O-antigen ligase
VSVLSRAESSAPGTQVISPGETSWLANPRARILVFLACLSAGSLFARALDVATAVLAALGFVSPGLAIALSLSVGISKGAAGGIGGIPVDLTIFSAVLLAIHTLVRLVVFRSRIRVGRWAWLVAISGIWVAISSAFTTWAPADVLMSAGWRYSLLAVPMALCVYALCQDARVLDAAVWAACAFAAVWVGATLRAIVTSQGSTAAVGSVNYISGATWAALAFLAFFGLAADQRGRLRWIAGAMVPAALVVLIASPSRGVLLAVSLVVLGLMMARSGGLKASTRVFVLVVTAATVGVFTYFMLMRTPMGASISRLRVWDLESSSIAARLSLWQYGWDKFAASPIFGWGIGMSEAQFGIGGYPHGLPQQVLFELGLAGCLIFWPMWLTGIVASLRAVRTYALAGSASHVAAVTVLGEWCLVQALDCLVSSSIADARALLLCLAVMVVADCTRVRFRTDRERGRMTRLDLRIHRTSDAQLVGDLPTGSE